jgi:hypothetical protein
MTPNAQPHILPEPCSFLTYTVYAIEKETDVAKVKELLSGFIRSSFVWTKTTEESLSYIKALPGGENALPRLPDPNYWIVVTRFRLNIDPMQVNWSMIKDMITRQCHVEWFGFGADRRLLVSGQSV